MVASVLAVLGGPLLSTFLKELIEMVKSTEFSAFIRRHKLSELEKKLLNVQCFLDRAGEKLITDASVKGYYDLVQHVVSDAENVLDRIQTDYLRKKSKPESHSDWLNNIVLIFHNKINKMMADILERLDQIEEPRIEERPEAFSTGSMVKKSGVFGRETEKDDVIQLLLSADESGDKIGVIPIVGMAGIGKTTLAQLVYNDSSKLKNHFGLKAWVCISSLNDDVSKTTSKILEAVTLSTAFDSNNQILEAVTSSPTFDSNNQILEAVTSSTAFDSNKLNLFQHKLKKSLKRKKFLLVLDNVWEVSYDKWCAVKMILESGLEGTPGSKIIVTTCNQKVAETMVQGQIYHLKSLSHADCCLLFEYHAFPQKIKPSNFQELRGIGSKIVAKFKGFPLAAKVLGGHLRCNTTTAQWEEISGSQYSELPTEIVESIISPLIVSYEYLPSPLKRCFKYCSIFPEGYVFDKNHIVLLWMAEGFLQNPSGNRPMEEVGHDYINSLISMSVFQPSSSDGSRFVVHDLFNYIASSQSGDFGFRLEGDQGCDIPKKTLHLSYIRKRFDASKKFKAMKEAKSLRTFLPLSSSLFPDTCYLTHKVPNDLLPLLKYLRVLSVSRYHNIQQLPESIGKLKHLRYMDVSGTAIEELPDSTRELINLQTLMLSDCYCLTKLPTDMIKNFNLRHLDVRGTILKEMPKHMSRLKNLHTLTNFTVGEHDGSKITELGELNHLQGALDILNLQNVENAGEADNARLKNKTKLDELLLEWSFNHNDASPEAIGVLEKLEPHKKLKRLTIKHYVGEIFPDWLVSFSNIVFLCLSNCRECSSLPPLGKLHCLRELSIIGFEKVTNVGSEFYGNDTSEKVTNVGSEFYGNDTSTTQTFGSLKILRFEDMLEWENWSCSKDECEFTCLRELYIVNCPKLNGSLLDHLARLEKLELAKCGKLKLLSGNDEVPSLSVRKMRISDMLELKAVPPGLIQKLAIEELVIHKCPLLKSFQVSGVTSTLKMLHIGGCGELDLVSEDENQTMIISYASLESLSIGSDSLKSFPLGSFLELNYLCLSACSNLKTISIPNGVQRDNLNSLSTLYIWGCPELESFPQGLSTPNLSSFWVWNCKTLKTLPEGMCNLSSLRKLYIGNCPELEGFPQGGLPSNLESLCISCCDELTSRRKEWNLQELKGLQCLEIGGECKVEKSFPEESLLPLSLTSLKISLFPKVEYLEKRGLQKLYSLQELKVSECVKLECLPKDCQLKSLSLLEIQGCPKLNKWCNGKGWPKISHIPNILIDEKLIS